MTDDVQPPTVVEIRPGFWEWSCPDCGLSGITRSEDLSREALDHHQADKDEPRIWSLPAEPDCPVRDTAGWVWEPDSGDEDAPWQSKSGRVATTWPMLLTRGPLTEVTLEENR